LAQSEAMRRLVHLYHQKCLKKLWLLDKSRFFILICDKKWDVTHAYVLYQSFLPGSWLVTFAPILSLWPYCLVPHPVSKWFVSLDGFHYGPRRQARNQTRQEHMKLLRGDIPDMRFVHGRVHDMIFQWLKPWTLHFAIVQ
jgi:hypothetical protein